MKTKYKFFCFILAACLIFPAYSAPVSSTDALAEKAMQSCPHNTLYKFDEETKTLNGVYEGNRVEALLADIAFVGDTAEVIWNGNPVTEGELQVGMIVEIYHGDLLYGEYTIEHLQESYPENSAQFAPKNGPMCAEQQKIWTHLENAPVNKYDEKTAPLIFERFLEFSRSLSLFVFIQ